MIKQNTRPLRAIYYLKFIHISDPCTVTIWHSCITNILLNYPIVSFNLPISDRVIWCTLDWINVAWHQTPWTMHRDLNGLILAFHHSEKIELSDVMTVDAEMSGHGMANGKREYSSIIVSMKVMSLWSLCLIVPWIE